MRLNGGAIREARRAQGLSQQKLANDADTSIRTIVRIELEGADPGANIVARIAKVLGVSMDSIFTQDEEEAAV